MTHLTTYSRCKSACDRCGSCSGWQPCTSHVGPCSNRTSGRVDSNKDSQVTTLACLPPPHTYIGQGLGQVMLRSGFVGSRVVTVTRTVQMMVQVCLPPHLINMHINPSKKETPHSFKGQQLEDNLCIVLLFL